MAEVDEVIDDFSSLAGHSILITGATGLLCGALADLIIRLAKTWASSGEPTRLYLGAKDTDKAIAQFSYALDSGGAQSNRNSKVIVFILPYNAAMPLDCAEHFDYIIHAAGYADPKHFATEPVETMQTIFTGTNNLLDYAAKTHSSRFLFISSSEVYGKIRSSGYLSEGDAGYVDSLSPRSCYPAAKRAAETLCASYAKEYGVNFVIARPGHVFGTGASMQDSRVIFCMLRDAAAGHDIVLKSSGEQRRSWVYATDCARALLYILLHGKSGTAYNIASRTSTLSILDVANIIARIAHVCVSRAAPSNGEEGAFNPMDDSSLDSARLEALGWRAQYSIENALKEMLDNYANKQLR